MPWPRGVPTRFEGREKPDDVPCRLGHVGNFHRGVARNGARFRKCRTCQWLRTKRRRWSAA